MTETRALDVAESVLWRGNVLLEPVNSSVSTATYETAHLDLLAAVPAETKQRPGNVQKDGSARSRFKEAGQEVKLNSANTAAALLSMNNWGTHKPICPCCAV